MSVIEYVNMEYGRRIKVMSYVINLLEEVHILARDYETLKFTICILPSVSTLVANIYVGQYFFFSLSFDQFITAMNLLESNRICFLGCVNIYP